MCMRKELANLKKTHLPVLVVFLMFTFSFYSTNAANKPKPEYLKSGSTYDITSVSGKIKLFRDFKAIPLASLEMHKLTSRRGNETKSLESYFPQDLWLHDQYAGELGRNATAFY